MNEHDATEQAYKNGYEQGVKACTEEIERLKTVEESHRLENGELRKEIKRLRKQLREAHQ